MFCRVAFNLAVDKLFTYIVPEHLRPRLLPGMRVLCPFGKRRLVGIVFELIRQTDITDLKEVESVLDGVPLLSSSMLLLATKIAHHYMTPLGQVLFAMIPAGVASGVRGMKVAVLGKGGETGTPKQRRLLMVLEESGGRLEVSELLSRSGVSRAVLKGLVRKGMVRIEEEFAPPSVPPWIEPPVKRLRKEQEKAVKEVVDGLGSHKVFLLWGVAGSGKTEVYIRSAEAALRMGLKTIVLVPEITLAPQTAGRFVSRFGERVVVLHSRLTRGQRAAAWWALKKGKADIVVGPRSAVFAPLSPLGLIVVDEEHETAYKQETTPRYNARDVALMRGQIEQAVVLLGSATPDVVTYHLASSGRYRMVRMIERVTEVPPPKVEVVNLLREGLPHSVSLTATLADALIKTVSAGRQAILFINRRGFAPIAVCGNCRFVLRCARCEVALTYHRANRQMVCHYCGDVSPPPRRCPSCGGKGVALLGAGTERVVREVASLLGQEPLRLDSDIVTSEERLEEILNAFREKRSSVLVGTQVVAKGLHFPNVDLVGVVYVDGLFNFPDHMAYERGFQLLMQVAGRAGRCRPGRVILQVVGVDMEVVKDALEGDYGRFVERELRERRSFFYPPFCRLVRIVVVGKREEVARRRAENLAQKLHQILPDDAHLLGPAPAPMPRLRGKWRFHILIKIKHNSSDDKEFFIRARRLLLSCSYISVDVDPVNMV